MICIIFLGFGCCGHILPEQLRHMHGDDAIFITGVDREQHGDVTVVRQCCHGVFFTLRSTPGSEIFL